MEVGEGRGGRGVRVIAHRGHIKAGTHLAHPTKKVGAGGLQGWSTQMEERAGAACKHAWSDKTWHGMWGLLVPHLQVGRLDTPGVKLSTCRLCALPGDPGSGLSLILGGLRQMWVGGWCNRDGEGEKGGVAWCPQSKRARVSGPIRIEHPNAAFTRMLTLSTWSGEKEQMLAAVNVSTACRCLLEIAALHKFRANPTAGPRMTLMIHNHKKLSFYSLYLVCCTGAIAIIRAMRFGISRRTASQQCNHLGSSYCALQLVVDLCELGEVSMGGSRCRCCARGLRTASKRPIYAFISKGGGAVTKCCSARVMHTSSATVQWVCKPQSTYGVRLSPPNTCLVSWLC